MPSLYGFSCIADNKAGGLMYTSSRNKESKCPVCKEHEEFEVVSGQVKGNSHILIVQCAKCGTAIGAIQDMNYITEIAEKLSKKFLP